MRFHLTNAPLFRGMTPEEIDALLSCLNAKARACKKGEIILMEGAPTEQLGVVLSGRVIIEMSDMRIIECDMTVFANSHANDIRLVFLQQSGVFFTNFLWFTFDIL